MTVRITLACIPFLAPATTRLPGLQWFVLLAMLVHIGASRPSRAEEFMDTGIPVFIKDREITLAAKTGYVHLSTAAGVRGVRCLGHLAR